VSNIYCVVFLFSLSSVLCLVCPMFPVSLDSPFLIAPSVFSSVCLDFDQTRTALEGPNIKFNQNGPCLCCYACKFNIMRTVPWNIKFICTRLKIEWTARQRFACNLVFKARTNTFYICPQCTYMYIVYVDVFTRIHIVILITPRYSWDTDIVGVKPQSIILIVMYLKYTC
jgi:hypothetical protein